MKDEVEGDKFTQINGIFSKFSEENKDKLLETAKKLLEVQREDVSYISVFRNEAMVSEGVVPKK